MIPLLVATAVGLFTWWVVRLRQKVLWIPSLAVIKKNPTRKPRLRLRPPEWLSYLMYALTAATLCWLSFKPTQKIAVQKERAQESLLFLIDLSASVSARITLEDYRQKVQELFRKMLANRPLQIFAASTSQSELFEIKDDAAAARFVSSMVFHRRSLPFQEVIGHLAEKSKNIDQLVIVSDRDAYSWGRLHHKSTWAGRPLQFLPVAENITAPKDNVFIEEALAQRRVRERVWSVTLRHVNLKNKPAGVLWVRQGENILGKASWAFPEGRDTLKIQVAAQLGAATDEVFHLELQTASENAINVDDHYESFAAAGQRRALHFRPFETEGRFMNASLFLSEALRALDFQVAFASESSFLQKDPPPRKQHLDLLLMSGLSLGEACGHFPQATAQQVWIFPEEIWEDSEVRSFLPCLSSWNPALMEKSWIFEERSAPRRWVQRKGGQTFLLFAQPLEALTQQGPLPLTLKKIFFSESPPQDRLSLPTLENVPLGESMLRVTEDTPEARFDLQNLQTADALTQTRFAVSEPWVFAGLCLLVLSLLVDLVEPRRGLAKLSLLLLLLLVTGGNEALAESQLSIVSVGRKAEKRNFDRIAQTIGQRTSITLAPQETVFSQWSDFFASAHIWVWFDSGLLPDPTQFQRWIKKGGFFIFEYRHGEELASFRKQMKLTAKPLSIDHELTRSFYLLDQLPSCLEQKGFESWEVYETNGQLYGLAAPLPLRQHLREGPGAKTPSCRVDAESLARLMINLSMVALTTDYKKDQVHLPEILKRIR